ncbi:MAG: sugar transferase, partial [Paraglaciecola sp.]|nr:sugar transferase [Paraglaciecola sp.]
MFSSSINRSKVSDKILMLGEISLILLSGHLGFILAAYFTTEPMVSLTLEWEMVYVAVFTFSTMLCTLSLGLYDHKLRETSSGIVKRVFLTQCFNVLFLEFIIFNIADHIDVGFIPLLISSLITVLLISSFRTFFQYHDLVRLSRRRILVLGSGERAAIIENRMRRDVDRRYFDLVGFVKIEGDKEGYIPEGKLINMDYLNDLFTYAEKHNIEQLVIACDERRNMLPVDLLFKCKTRGIDVTDILDFIE